ncbi:MAG TPA: AI-2E family transporter [Candidatus Paceibacterota bacterium]|nr:AI-2E family transporter [Candidatus Paceibacterota bacterium]
MDTKRFQLYFFIALLLAILALTLRLFQPFIAPLALAFMTAIVVRPVHRWIMARTSHRRGLSATLTVLFVLLVILVPLGVLLQQITLESISFLSDVKDGKLGGLDEISAQIARPIQDIFPSFTLDLAPRLKAFAAGIVSNAGNIFSFTTSAGLSLFIAIVGLFYMLRDGHTFKKGIVELSPLADKYDNQIIDKIERAVNSVVKGSLFTALIKGILAAVGFAIFGVPHAILWGTLTAIVALLPGIGAGITLIPAIIFLLAIDSLGAAIGLAVWSVVVVGLVDNIVMPFIVGRGFTVHPLFVLLSVVGGLIFFGPIGLFLGPLVVALLSALVEIYKLVILDDEGKRNTVI